MPLDIRAFIFDLDGVITDTAEYHFRSWKRLADEENIPFTRQDNEALRGVSRRESLNRMLKGRAIDEATAQAWMERKNAYYIAYLNEITPANVLPGALNLLDEARKAGIKTAIASASKNAQTVLDRLQIADRFDAVGDGYSVINTKPAPDLFVWTAGRLGVSPGHAVIFEDAEAGIAAAITGGFWSVGIGSAEVQKADVVLSDLANIHVAQIVARLSAAQARRTSE
ncbi:MAG TPA: beta-phosphoglucomutase [Phototrophicaceae bacterium]|nr:beta-phosphoglucomutase [Phototrophicaceae bacterium]